MYYYDGFNEIILDIILLVGILSLMIFIFNWVMRRIFGVERQKWFSNNYVNDKHKKYDIRLRNISLLAYVCLALYFFYTIDHTKNSNTLSLYLFLFGLGIAGIQWLLQAYMEWKYLKGKNNYLLTLSQWIFIFFLLIVLLNTNFFGLMNE